MANLDIVKNAVAESTKDLMRSKPIDQITVNDICKQTGLQRRNFYRYFRDKYEVIEWIYYHDYLLNTEHFEGWSLWDYMPHIANVLYSDRAYYINAFAYTGQNSFRDTVIRYLLEIFRPDYAACFPSEFWFNFYFEHTCNIAFDSFVIWLSSEPCMTPEEFVKHFRDLFYKPAVVSCALIEREPPGREKYVQFAVKEPAKK